MKRREQYAPWSEDPDPDEHSNVMTAQQSKLAAKKVGKLMDRHRAPERPREHEDG